MYKYAFAPVDSFLYFFTLFLYFCNYIFSLFSLSLLFPFSLFLSSFPDLMFFMWYRHSTSITTGLIFLNIVAQSFNYINLLVVAWCCIFEISNNN